MGGSSSGGGHQLRVGGAVGCSVGLQVKTSAARCQTVTAVSPASQRSRWSVCCPPCSCLFFLKSHLPRSQASLPWCFQNLALAQFEAVTPKSSATGGGKGPCDLSAGVAVRGSGAHCTPVVWVCSRRRPGEIMASLQRAALYLTGSGSHGDSL